MMLGMIRWMEKRTYSTSSRIEHRYMLEISPVQYLALGVETTLFQWILTVSIEAVCIETLP